MRGASAFPLAIDPSSVPLSGVARPDGVAASYPHVKLSESAKETSVYDLIALFDAEVRRDVARIDAKMRRNVARRIMWLFSGTNLFTLIALAAAFWIDHYFVVNKIITPQERVVTSDVIIALLGATTIQVGALMLVIGKNLFPAPNKP